MAILLHLEELAEELTDILCLEQDTELNQSLNEALDEPEDLTDSSRADPQTSSELERTKEPDAKFARQKE